MENLIIFPPFWSASHPYLSLPCLTAYLKENNIDIHQADLNIESFDYFISKHFFDLCYEKIKIKDLEDDLKAKYNAIYNYLNINIDFFYSVMKKKDLFLDIEKYKKAKVFLNEAYSFISLAFHPFSIARGSLSFGVDITLENIEGLICNNDSNPYIEFYKSILDKFPIDKLKFIGISLSSDSQIVPTITLCNILKEKNSNLHISVGGNVFSKIYDKLDKFKALFKYFDSILVFEGEYPLLKLIKAVHENTSLEKVPNCVYLENGELIFTNMEKAKLSINELPTPNFDGFNLNSYYSPEVILPYYVSRSCFWGKCAFCDHDFGYDGKYRVKSIDKVIYDLKQLKSKYDVDIIHFVDEALTVPFIDKLSDRLIQENLNIKWFAYIKADEKYSLALCEKMKKSGCLQVLIGVESCSPKILNDMDKGITVEDVRTVITNMDKAGIWAHSFMIHNFPTESDTERLETLLFVMNNKFHSIGLGEFSLSKNSKIMLDLDRYGIDKTEEGSGLNNNLKYTLRKVDSKNIYKELLKIYKQNIYNKLFTDIIFEREHLPIYMKKYDLIANTDNLKSITYEPKFNVNDLIIQEYESEVLIYNPNNNKQYIVNNEFQDILAYLAKGNDKSSLEQYLGDIDTEPDIIVAIINFVEELFEKAC